MKCTTQTESLPMSIVVHLPAELEKTIAAEAAKAGMTISDYVAGRLVQGTAADGPKRRLTGPSLVQRWKELGLIGYRTDITDPEAHSRRLREAAQRRTPG